MKKSCIISQSSCYFGKKNFNKKFKYFIKTNFLWKASFRQEEIFMFLQNKVACKQTLSFFIKQSFWQTKQHILINVCSCNITLIKRVQVFQADVSKYLRITKIFWKALSPSGWDVYLLQKSFWTNENKLHSLSLFPLSNSSSAKI